MPCTSTPTHWTPEATLEFLELLAAFASQNGGIIPPTSTYVQWTAILSPKHTHDFTVKPLRSRYQCFRKVYHLFMGMKNDSGFGWDDALQMVSARIGNGKITVRYVNV